MLADLFHLGKFIFWVYPRVMVVEEVIASIKALVLTLLVPAFVGWHNLVATAQASHRGLRYAKLFGYLVIASAKLTGFF